MGQFRRIKELKEKGIQLKGIKSILKSGTLKEPMQRKDDKRIPGTESWRCGDYLPHVPLSTIWFFNSKI